MISHHNMDVWDEGNYASSCAKRSSSGSKSKDSSTTDAKGLWSLEADQKSGVENPDTEALLLLINGG
jgi:hypothetical protein